MKIAMATEWFLPKPGGVAIHTYELSKKLVEMGNEVHVITSRRKKISVTDKRHKFDGLTVHRLCGLKYSSLDLLFNVFTPFKLKELFKEEKFDVVHGQHIFTPLPIAATTVAKIMHPRVECVVATSHSIYDPGKEELMVRIWRRPLKGCLGKADKLIAVNDTVAKAAAKIVPKKKIVVVPNGIDTSVYSPRTKKRDLNVKGPVVMSTGRLVRVKGFEVLIKSAREILNDFPDAAFVIVGGGKTKKELADLTKKLGLEKNVRLLGERKPSEIPGLLAACDVFALPSLKEAQPRALIEAMACGKPIVGTKVGGVPNTIEDGKTGVLVKPGNARQLANAIKGLLSNKKLSRKLGRNARRVAVEKYSWDKVAKQTYELYEQVLEGDRWD